MIKITIYSPPLPCPTDVSQAGLAHTARQYGALPAIISMFILKIIFSICTIGIFTGCDQNQSSKPLSNTSASLNDTSDVRMTEEKFWAIIERTRKAGSYQAQLGELENELLKLPVSEIEKFDNRLTSLMANSYTYKLWGAAYVINGGCSDDCFDYFRQYLISHGKARFYQALSDPESMAPWIKSEEQEEWEGLGYAAGNAYLIKANKSIPKSYAPQYKIVGKPFKEEDLPREYPKLAKKFMQ